MFIKKKDVLLVLLAVAACGAWQLRHTSLAAAETPAAARTRKIVDAANAFLATLTDAQKKAALFAFNDAEQRARWSNFPDGFVVRRGVGWGEMNAAQRAALMDL